jgi:3-oxosteroid 1-dehydrogenase
MSSKLIPLPVLSLSIGTAVATTIITKQLGLGEPQPTKPEPKESARVLYVTNTKKFDRVVDIIIVGAGASGLMAAVSALWTNPKLSILVLERADSLSTSTTAKSGGVFWLARQDEREEDFVKLIGKRGWPTLFKPDTPPLYGLPEPIIEKLHTYYVVSKSLRTQLVKNGTAPYLSQVTTPDGQDLVDYSFSTPEEQPDNKTPTGRHLTVGTHPVITPAIRGVSWTLNKLRPIISLFTTQVPSLKELYLVDSFGLDFSKFGLGFILVNTLADDIRKRGGVIETGKGVESLVMNIEDDGVSGICTYGGGEFIGATRGVIFATGGYSHDMNLIQELLISKKKKLQQTGASKYNRGTMLKIAQKLNHVPIDEIDKIWGCEAFASPPDVVPALPWENETCLFQMRGDSFFTVNARGVRVYNEKQEYDLRCRVHYEKPENEMLFAIADVRCIEQFGSDVAKSWPVDPANKLYTKGNTLIELTENLRKRFSSMIKFSPDFTSQVIKTFDRFQTFALQGIDEDFHRGKAPSDRQWTRSPTITTSKNPAMVPLSNKGPYYAIALVGSIIDTKGGPRTDLYSRIMKDDPNCTITDGDIPIPRLYACGNASSPISGDAYISGGHTLGSAMVTGYMAGLHAAGLQNDIGKVAKL